MPPIGLLMARNGMRNPMRTTLTIAGIAVGVIAFGFLQTVLAAYFIGVEASSPNRLVTRHRVSLFNLLPISQRKKILEIPGVTQVSYGVWFGGYYQDPQQFFGQVGVDPDYLKLYPEFILPDDQKKAYANELQAAVVGRKLAKRFGWGLGDRVTLTSGIFSGTWDFIIRGIYHGRDRATDETLMFFHWKRLDERLLTLGRGSQVGWYLVGVENPRDNGRIISAIDAMFVNSSAPTLTETEKDFNLSFVSMMGTIITIIKIASWIVIGIILLIMANTMMMSARERIAEYGVMKTLGFRTVHLVALIAGEAVCVSLIGTVVGCLLNLGIISVVGRGIEETMGSMFPVFELTSLTIAYSAAMALAAGLAACVVPIGRAVRVPIADALRRID
ncbi:MAG: ABC transporter permease [Acidobacteriota bacterium]